MSTFHDHRPETAASTVTGTGPIATTAALAVCLLASACATPPYPPQLLSEVETESAQKLLSMDQARPGTQVTLLETAAGPEAAPPAGDLDQTSGFTPVPSRPSGDPVEPNDLTLAAPPPPPPALEAPGERARGPEPAELLQDVRPVDVAPTVEVPSPQMAAIPADESAAEEAPGSVWPDLFDPRHEAVTLEARRIPRPVAGEHTSIEPPADLRPPNTIALSTDPEPHAASEAPSPAVDEQSQPTAAPAQQAGKRPQLVGSGEDHEPVALDARATATAPAAEATLPTADPDEPSRPALEAATVEPRAVVPPRRSAPQLASVAADLPKAIEPEQTLTGLQIQFVPGSSELSAAARADLTSLVRQLDLAVDPHLRLSAFAAAGDVPLSDSRRLSLLRLFTIRDFLVAQGLRDELVDLQPMPGKEGGDMADRVDLAIDRS